MTTIGITLIIINGLVLAFLLIDWFRKNYTIVDLETWNTIATFYNEEHDESKNCGGGVGFFREALYEEEYDEEEE